MRGGGGLLKQEFEPDNNYKMSPFLKRFILDNKFKMGAILILSDVVTLLASSILMLWLWSFVRSDIQISAYYSLLPFLLLFIFAYTFSGLYSSGGIGPVDELRLLSLTTTFVFLILGTLSFWIHSIDMYSRASFLGIWVISITFLPFSRSFFRTVLSQLKIWGEPVAFIGEGKESKNILNYIIKNPKLGMKPVVLMTNDHDTQRMGKGNAKIFSLNQYHEFLVFCKDIKIRRIIISPLNNSEPLDSSLIENLLFEFSSIIIIPISKGLNNIWISPFYLGHFQTSEVQQNLLRRSQIILKRVLDITLASVLLIFLLPLFVLISFIILLDSPGSIFYKQKRIGKDGKQFEVYKFRTMYQNADRILNHYLEQHEDIKKEWEIYHKLKNDLRVTRIGNVLRRISLDELPQLWNVIRGEMSLVGPRPIVQKEVLPYGTAIKAYKAVKPGLTGLWQISGRNSIKFSQRVKLDEYYIYNWSIWMDLYILSRTIIAVLRGDGV